MAAYIEMSRDLEHGGGLWSFPNCVWSPTRKKNGQRWPYWRKILKIQEGDIVLHLRGAQPDAEFVGYSVASGNGFETSRRPPNPKEWGFSESFYRADLEDFRPFSRPINLTNLFEARQLELEDYFDRNRARGAGKLNLFYVRQAGRLQCQNGAYLSDASTELLQIILDGISEEAFLGRGTQIETDAPIRQLAVRVGQKAFADSIKGSYGNRCCFPGCNMSDRRFLIGAHIARWSDNPGLRGELGNGLCLCVFHDKAFELGLFTLDQNFRIYTDPQEEEAGSSAFRQIAGQKGKPILMGDVPPLHDALLEHWIRVDLDPIG